MSALQLSTDEEATVRNWVANRLFEDGRLTPTMVNKLVAADVDYRRVLKLLDAGCPPRLVVKILT